MINEGVGEGTIGVLGGTPATLSLGWQQCHIPALGEGIDVINPPADENSTTGDTYWANDIARDVVRGWLSTNPDMAGFSYEYADGLYTADGVEIDNMTIAVRTDEQTLFCDWARQDSPTSGSPPAATVAHRGDRPDDEHRRRRDPGRDRGPSRDASEQPGRL